METTPSLFAVIVENTFTSIADMAKQLFHVFLLDYIPILCYKNVVRRKKWKINFVNFVFLG